MGIVQIYPKQLLDIRWVGLSKTGEGVGEDLKVLAISLALLSAVALAVGSQLQNGAVGIQKKAALSGRSHFSFKQLLELIKHPRWVTGLGISIAALVLQFTALLLAPLIVVQPIGAFALVITSIITARITRTRLNMPTVLAIGLCTAGLGAFVVMAHQFAVEPEIDDNSLLVVLALAIATIAVFGYIFFSGADRFKPMTFVFGAGILYGFVATLTKVAIKRLFNQDGFNRMVTLKFELMTDGLTLLVLLSMVAAGFLGAWFVQNAYTSGPPDLVIAGLTVIDPLVAVSIGFVVLNEAMNAPLPVVLGFIASGAMSVIGVFMLSKVHPAVTTASAERLR